MDHVVFAVELQLQSLAAADLAFKVTPQAQIFLLNVAQLQRYNIL